MIKVAIIDDGVGVGFYNICDVNKKIEITSDLLINTINEQKMEKCSHGTTCVAIINKYYNNANITSIKILDNISHRGKSSQLIKAIEWCIDNDIRVINLSIGTVDYNDFEKIRDVINKAHSKNIIMIAACHNSNIFTYPASCTNIIGIKCSKINKLNEGDYIFNLYPLDGIQITACSEHKLIKANLELEITPRCNSYAAPMITAEVCKIVDKYENITLDQVKQKLYESSINYSNNKVKINNYKNIDWISNIAILSLDKEEKNFTIPFANKISTLKTIDEANVDSFDTLILLSNDKINCKDINNIIDKIEKQHKNIIVIDDEFYDNKLNIKYPNDDIKFWHKSVVNKFYEEPLPQKEIDVPLIMVYDYTKSDSVEVVKELISSFRNDGYYAGGICTKSIGVLYGLEYIPTNNCDNLKKVKCIIEALHKVYWYDVVIFSLNVNKEDDNLIKELNNTLNPDKTIVVVDDWFDKTQNYKTNFEINDTIVIASQNYPENMIGNKLNIFKNKDFNLVYKHILEMLLNEN